MSNQDILLQFYKAFAEEDAIKMVSFYHSDIVFEDPVFGRLKGDQVKAMWHMLISKSRGDLKITFKNIRADEQSGSAQWTAQYYFGRKKRKVVNHVKANFIFKDGKIIQHTDDFNFKNWAQQALGLTGWLFGRTSFLKRKIQTTVNFRLNSFIKR